MIKLLQFMMITFALVGCTEFESRFAIDYDDGKKVVTLATSNTIWLGEIGENGACATKTIRTKGLPKLVPMQLVNAGSKFDKSIFLFGTESLPRVWHYRGENRPSPIPIDALSIAKYKDGKLFALLSTHQEIEDCGCSFVLAMFDMDNLADSQPKWTSTLYCSNGGSNIQFSKNSGVPVVTWNDLPFEIYVIENDVPTPRELNLENPSMLLHPLDPMGRQVSIVVSDDLQYLAMSQSSEKQYVHAIWDLQSGKNIYLSSGNFVSNHGFRNECLLTADRICFGEGESLTTFSLLDSSTSQYKISANSDFLHAINVEDTSVWVVRSESPYKKFKGIARLEMRRP
uniref:Lipoprotein n=1 Tax=uncultured bacterium A1Q1_fos_1815 TaxID=1256553 RepID=L7VWG1_9BACT|nr:hypothetical protein [uncultured bacterium A1Q1_fos_1815]